MDLTVMDPTQSDPRGAPPPDQDQRELIQRELSRNVLVEAAAGTGKTTSMVGRMVGLLCEGRCTGARHLAAVTFTRKAAAELRERFRRELERRLGEVRAGGDEAPAAARLEAALASVEQCFIGTIHAFCARLLRERPVEAGVDLAFEELEPEEDLRLRGEAWAAFVDGLLASPSTDRDLLAQLEARGLDPRQLAPAFAAFCDYPDVQAWPAPPDGELTVALDPVVEALAAYLRHMRKLAPRIPADYGNDSIMPEYHRLPRIISHLGDLRGHPARLMLALARFDYRSKQVVQREWKRTGRFTAAEARAELARWNLFRARHVVPTLNAWYEHRYGPALRALTAARRIYDALRAQRGRLNYQDLLLRAAGLLREQPHVRRYFAARYTHLLVDEFQDTDPVQAEVLLLLMAAAPDERDWRRCRPRPGALFVVGDPKQSIYRFRRADIVTYDAVKAILVDEGEGRLARLSANFRTVPEIVDWVNGVFEPCFPERSTAASPRYVALEAARAEVARPELDPDLGPSQDPAAPAPTPELRGVRALWIPEEHAATNAAAVAYEADRIARTIRAALEGGWRVSRAPAGGGPARAMPARPDDFMIVTLKRAHLGAYARALQRLGVPHAVSGGNALNRVEALRLLHLCLAAAVQPDNPVAVVAALRSELFGVSDVALYGYKRAGGRFVPHAGPRSARRRAALEALTAEDAAALQGGLDSLARCAAWLATLPAVAALERAVEHLGLLPLAAAQPGGDVEAGSLAKALELLRRAASARGEVWSAAQLVEHLGQLVEQDETHDGISAHPAQRLVTRVMNLHKVKGLEAPVVFLADPTGRPRDSVEEVALHVDRAGPLVQGFLAIDGPARGYRAPRLCRPEGWAELAARELTFVEAERLRLRYVAATRAGCLLVISQRRKRNDRNPWQPFERALRAMPELEDPGPQRTQEEAPGELDPGEPGAAAASIEQRQRAVVRPSYAVSAAKRFALGQRLPPAPVAGAQVDEDGVGEQELAHEHEHGLAWGAAIHALLQLCAEDAQGALGLDLEAAARAALAEQELDPAAAPAARATVEAVLGSPLWARARRARRRLAEAPFSVLLPADEGLPTVVRGVIDLVFLEPEGWVLVDYKTDRLAGRDASTLARHYAPQLRLYAEAWRRCISAPVKELGVLFTDGCGYHVVQ
jgi:ATP-dependent helicase/nuclease subunit A